MKKLTLILTLFVANICLAQTYEEAMDKCTKTFEAELNYSDIRLKLKNLHECIVGKRFPDFTATSVNGKALTRKDLKGKVVLINLWFIHCAPCVAEMPMLNELSNEFGTKGFLLLSFSTDDRNAILEFLKDQNTGYEVFAESSDLIHKRFKMTFGYPTNIFLDKEGKIIEFKNGGPIDEQALKKTKEEFKGIVEKALSK